MSVSAILYETGIVKGLNDYCISSDLKQITIQATNTISATNAPWPYPVFGDDVVGIDLSSLGLNT